MEIEKVELNIYDGEKTLLQGIIGDMIVRFSQRAALPYSIHHFRQFVDHETNTISIRLKGVPYTGLETLMYVLLLERLNELREHKMDIFSDHFEILKNQQIKFKSLLDEDVWFAFAEVEDDQTLVFHFLILTFEIRESLQSVLEV